MKRKIIGQHIFILSALLLLAVLWGVSGIGCPVRHLTGIPCPACGITRAYIAFFQGDFHRAMQYHPLFLLAPVLIFLGIHERSHVLSRVPRKILQSLLYAGGALFVIVYFIRLLWFTIP